MIVSAGEIDCEDFNEEWMKEYANGMQHEIYRTDLSYKVSAPEKRKIAWVGGGNAFAETIDAD